MSENRELHQYWEVWYPQAAATGLLLARGLIAPMKTLLFHAPAEVITVEVSDHQGQRLAYGTDLKQTDTTPICRLRREGERITRQDIWPTEAELGLLVLLPGGEVGTLKSWWHAADKKEWRWQVEFYNTIR
ncbi:MAG: hypothetical protein M5U01_29390 [Ardenticatenaceae bacterium]|nr:hypothetical protein [Ardenticatenaceae bacterium]